MSVLKVMGQYGICSGLLCSPISFKNAESDKLMAVKLSEGDQPSLLDDQSATINIFVKFCGLKPQN